LRAIVTQCWQ